MKDTTADQPKKLGAEIRFSYGLADVGFSWMVSMTNMYLLLFLTDVCMIPAAVAGSIMFFGRILDAISPPFVGSMIEKRNPKWGKYRTWVMVGAILTFIFNIILFLLWGQGAFMAILCTMVYAAFCIATNVAYTGYTSMNSSLTKVPTERVVLSAARAQGGALGKIIAGFTLLPMISLLGGQSMSHHGFFLTAIVVSAALLLTYWNLFRATKGKDTQAIVAVQSQETTQDKLTLGETFKVVLTNRPLIFLFLADILRILAGLVVLAIYPYYFIYVAGDMNATSIFFGLTSVFAFAGASLVPFITRKLSNRTTYILGMVIIMCAFIIANFLKESTVAMVGTLCVGYIGLNFGSTINTAMYADTVDYGIHKFGKNLRAVYFSMFQLSIKIAAIGSTGISGFGLALIGFQAGAEPTEQVIAGLNFIALALPIGLLAGCIVLLLFYNLTNKKMGLIRAELAEKNKTPA